MAIARRDDFLTDALGRALSGAQVFYCLQPATTTTTPPSPLATVYSDLTGDVTTNPQLTDGLGHSVAYLDNSVLYTIVFVHPLFLTPVILQDQACNGGSSSGGSGGNAYTPVQASTAAGMITGAIPGAVFVLPSTPLSGSLILQVNGQVLTPTVGYNLSGLTLTLTAALQAGDGLNANYLTAGGGGSYSPVQASTAQETITGAIPGTAFVLPSVPVSQSLSLAVNGQILTPGLGYMLTGGVITLLTALQAGDGINANYLVIA